MDPNDLEGKKFNDKYDTDIFERWVMDKETAMLLSNKTSCLDQIENLKKDGIKLLQNSLYKNNDDEIRDTAINLRDKIIKE